MTTRMNLLAGNINACSIRGVQASFEPLTPQQRHDAVFFKIQFGSKKVTMIELARIKHREYEDRPWMLEESQKIIEFLLTMRLKPCQKL